MLILPDQYHNDQLEEKVMVTEGGREGGREGERGREREREREREHYYIRN